MECRDLPERLDGADLQYAPTNEMGVVFLFAGMLRRWWLSVEKIQTGFPDCVALQSVGGRQKRVAIEFELRSSNFKIHRHRARGCDWIVCWEHDWPDVPARLRVIELRKYFGLGFKVWFHPVDERQQHFLDKDRIIWAARKSAHKGDLMLAYRCAPEKCVRDVFVLSTELRRERCNRVWRNGTCLGGKFDIVCRLKTPLFLEQLKRHPILGKAGFMRGSMQGNKDVTESWPEIYELIVAKNPKVKSLLAPYSPESLP